VPDLRSFMARFTLLLAALLYFLAMSPRWVFGW
jgi:hypothetical protein